jgi:hypothetical protein
VTAEFSTEKIPPSPVLKYGISVYIDYGHHNPPHIHAIYGESEALVDIRSGDIISGKLPRRASKLVAEWRDLRPLLRGPVFEPLLDPEAFARCFIDPVCRTVCWPNGADFAPEAIRVLVPAEAHANG